MDRTQLVTAMPIDIDVSKDVTWSVWWTEEQNLSGHDEVA